MCRVIAIEEIAIYAIKELDSDAISQIDELVLEEKSFLAIIQERVAIINSNVIVGATTIFPDDQYLSNSQKWAREGVESFKIRKNILIDRLCLQFPDREVLLRRYCKYHPAILPSGFLGKHHRIAIDPPAEQFPPGKIRILVE